MKSNSSTRLTKTKVFFLVFLLVLPIIGGSFFYFSHHSSTSSKITRSTAEQLNEQKQQAINQVQTQIANNPILTEIKLLETIKNNYLDNLNSDFTKLTNYLQGANSLEELTNRQTKIQ